MLSICHEERLVFRLGRIALLTLCVHPLFGSVVLDGSFGTSGALPGPNYMVSAGFGKQVGGNLFHSFNQFNLISSESATFSGPNTVHNILARVTSGSASSIDGTVNSSIQGANLFFLNPAGVMFGPNAQINVSGSFAVSTANYLKLADGGKFNTSLGGGDVLTSAPVSAFGFLNPNVGSVSINGSSLNMPDGKSFAVIGGDISVGDATILAPSGLMSFLSVKSAGQIPVTAGEPALNLDLSSFASLGNINMSNCYIAADGDGPGGMVIRGANFVLDFSYISADVTGAASGRGIDIRLTGDLNAINGSFIDTSALIPSAGDSTGNAGDINIRAAHVNFFDSFISTSTAEFALGFSGTARGNAGNIRIEAASIVLSSFSDVDSSTYDVGNAGRIDLVAHDILLDQVSTVRADQDGGGLGNGGPIRIETSSLVVRDGSQITSATFGFGDVVSGAGGDITIVADSILIDGREEFPFRDTGIDAGNIADTPLGGKPGNITIQTGSLQLLGFAIINNSNGSAGDAGSISITAKDIVLDPAGAGVPITNIQSGNDGTGQGGNINIDTGTLKLFAGAGIFASTAGSGPGGQIVIRADDILLDGTNTAVGFHAGGIFANTSHFFGVTDGNGGDINIQTGSLQIENGDQISASTSGLGNGGNVNVTAASLFIDGAGVQTGIFADAVSNSSGNAGSVAVQAGDLAITRAGSISANELG